MSEKSSSVKPDLIGLTSSTLVKLGRFALRHIGSPNNSYANKIMLNWKRNDICTETKERGKDYTEKKYPTLVEKTMKGHNRVLRYKIPTGLNPQKVMKSLYDIEFDLKSEVLFKRLENDPKAHFSLTILSGKLLDIINYSNEASITPDGKELSKGLWIPLGWSRRGLEQLNLASSNSPHLMIGGATGGGKSILGRLILATLHIRYNRDECRLWLCDLKHGNGTARLGKNPLLVDRTISDPGEAEQMMDDLSVIIGERYNLFKEYECDDLQAFNEEYPRLRLPRIVVYVDELTKLEGKEFSRAREKMTKVTGESRGAGVHVIISCHRPTANLVSGTMKNNISAVVAFNCNAVSARVLLGEDPEDYKAASMIDPDIEGRALFKFKDEVLLQVPYIDNHAIKSLMANYQKAIIKGKVEPVIQAVISTRVVEHSVGHSLGHTIEHPQ
ncbi:hypothetical protein SBF1_50102 [Candidatus Desulfosporosinus infrequens]|uniref:FtsK domain-containing protein n=1 Tax=Candidatus Desulfosporosinus infrequens TaxID=2043169 RepID=A0A2U3LH52_9FIRM|nr:hypothetical protein SBF1_50102 [Candidatus Desulfosporosinus infrequens]